MTNYHRQRPKIWRRIVAFVIAVGIFVVLAGSLAAIEGHQTRAFVLAGTGALIAMSAAIYATAREGREWGQ